MINPVVHVTTGHTSLSLAGDGGPARRLNGGQRQERARGPHGHRQQQQEALGLRPRHSLWVSLRRM